MFWSEATRLTVIHRLHPFVKMGVGIGFTGLALCLREPSALAVLMGFLLGVLGLARLRPSGRRMLFAALFLGAVTGLNFWAARDSSHAAAYSLRLAVFILAVPVCAGTTAPQELARALAMTPLPAGMVVALMLVWRFFPMMAAELQQMRQAARLRGRAGGGLTRIYRGLVVPLAFCVLDYTDRITLALELRGFSPGSGRTCRRRPAAGAADAGFLLLALGAVLAAGWLQGGGGVP